MKKKVIIQITIVSFIVGLMTAIQYNTIQEPTERDTRDIWEIRQDLSEEKKRHSELLSKIAQLQETLDEYEDGNSDNQRQLLQDTVEKLRQKAGLSPVTGPGVELTIRPAPELVQYGYTIEQISPDLLTRLVNEIFRFNGKYIEIDGQRIVHTTAIRDINGQTTINSRPINNSNVNIVIITDSFEQAEKLYSYLYSSTLPDAFYVDNLLLDIHEAKEKLTVSSYDGEFSSMYLTEIENEGE